MKLSSNVVSWPRFFVSHCCPAVRIRYVYDNIVRGGVSPTLHCSNMISRPCFYNSLKLVFCEDIICFGEDASENGVRVRVARGLPSSVSCSIGRHAPVGLASDWVKYWRMASVPCALAHDGTPGRLFLSRAGVLTEHVTCCNPASFQ